MSGTRYFLRAALAGAAIVFMACGGKVVAEKTDGGVSTGGAGAGAGGAGTGAYDACVTAADCGWGEIDHEILTPADCVCLYGCPYIALSQETVDRRSQQYNQLCSFGVDGQGNPCGIDDCAGPPVAACNAGHCGAAAF